MCNETIFGPVVIKAYVISAHVPKSIFRAIQERQKFLYSMGVILRDRRKQRLP